MKKTFRIFYALAVIAIVMALDYTQITNYVTRSLLKIITFFIIPALMMKRENFVALVTPRKADKFAPLMTIGIAALIIGAYYALGGLFNLSGVAPSIEAKYGIGAENFAYVAVYIALLNSLLEEFFFRGFLYLDLNKRYAFLISATLFTLYHMSLFDGWFNPVTTMLTTTALFIAGALFNLLAYRSKTIVSSYIFHMGANIGINIVGYILMQK